MLLEHRDAAGEIVGTRLSRLGIAVLVLTWVYALGFIGVLLLRLGVPTRQFEELGFIPLTILPAVGCFFAGRRAEIGARERMAWRLLAAAWLVVGLGAIASEALPDARWLGITAQDYFDAYASRLLSLVGFSLLLVRPRGRYAYAKLGVEIALVLLVTASLALYYQYDAGGESFARAIGSHDTPALAGTWMELAILLVVTATLHRSPQLPGGAALQLIAISKFATTVGFFLSESARLYGLEAARQAADIVWAVSAAGFFSGTLLYASVNREGDALRQWPRDMRVLPYISMLTIGLLVVHEVTDDTIDGPSIAALALTLLIGSALIVLRLLIAGRQIASAAEQRGAQAQRLNTLVRRSAEALVILDTGGRITFASPAVEMLLWASHESLLGRSISEFVAARDRAEVEKMCGDPEDGAIITWQTNMGADARDVESQVTDLRFDDEVRGVVLHCRDVTQRRRHDRELRQTQKLEAVGLLAGGIAHDFNNLLTVIKANAELLHIDHPAVGVTELEDIVRASERGASLCRQLLAFSRSGAPERESLDAAVLINDMEPMLRRVLPKAVQLVIHGEPGEVWTNGDTVQLDIVLMNLVTNSCDALPNGGVISVETSILQVSQGDAWQQRAVPHGSYARLTVTDDGDGMSDEALAHAFEPFFTTKPTGKGTGLGLATVHGIITAHEGFVRIDSAGQRGTTVTLLLPLAVSAHERPRVVTPMRTTAEGRGRILVVEDEEAIRALIVRYLTRAGFDIMEAPEGVSALAILEAESWKVDLVLSDMMMPKMNGGTLARRVLAANPNISVIVMSGYAREDGSGQAALPEQVVHLAKPFSMSELGAVVRDTLKHTTGAS